MQLPHSPELRALTLLPQMVLELGGFKSRPPLLDARGGRSVSLVISAVIGAVVAFVVLFALAASCRLPLGVTAGLTILTLVALDLDVGLLVIVAALATVGSGIWLATRLVALPADDWAVTFMALVAASALSWGTARAVWTHRRRRAGLDSLARLHAEVERFNAIVRTVDVAYQLAAQRGRVELEAPGRVELQALARTHTELVRALRIERILRENRDLLSHVAMGGELDLSPLEVLRVDATASDYVVAVREAVSVAVNVRDELERMRARVLVAPRAWPRLMP